MFGTCESYSRLDAWEGVGNGGRYRVPGAVSGGGVFYKYHPALYYTILNCAIQYIHCSTVYNIG